MKDLLSTKRVALLHPKIRSDVNDFINEAETALGITLRIAQGFRSLEEQTAIYNQPWDKKDNDGDGLIDEKDEKVSNAPAGTSFHNYGLAVDLVKMVNGKPDWKFNYELLLPFATKYGFKWGGHFKKLKDKPHFEKSFGYGYKDLLAMYKANKFIPGTKFLNL